ncbi:class I SAM-dependent methyltransferase [Desulfonatronovibrio magnus]|uniref:class I SAM-dependent methyltransferase n=1 Tax=Desulfonatronovibrio magnus TaxID=698827 RepID=UPI000695F3B2|nr:methyltransferase domain-containing protein [Desulfonatronovibrio magnus]
MQDEAYLAYIEETSSWLHKGRINLIDNIFLSLKLESKRSEMLEIGAGAGQNTEVLSKFGTVDVLEIDPKGIKLLRDLPYIHKVIDKPIYSKLSKLYDIICAFDVVEHMENDKDCLSWVFESLKPGGLFIATVPAYQWLFSCHDISLNHHRRYTSKSFRSLLPHNTNVLIDGYFNSVLLPVVVISRCAKGVKNIFMKDKIYMKQKVPQSVIFSSLFFHILKFESMCVSKRVRFPFGLTYYLAVQKV